MSDQKSPGRWPSWDSFQTVSAPPVTLHYMCLPEDHPKPGGMGRAAIPERTTSQLWQQKGVLVHWEGVRAPSEGTSPALVCRSRTCAHETCPSLPRRGREARERCERCSFPTFFQFQPASRAFEVVGQKAWPVLMWVFSVSLWDSASFSISGRQTKVNRKAWALEAEKPQFKS